MTDFINKFKIPTILGLSVIFLGIASGVYLVLREQVFFSQAAPNLTPQNITFANITDDSIVLSWQTNSSTPSFVTFGQNNPGEETTLDERDINTPKPHSIHYVTLKNLLPQTKYQFKIISGKLSSDIFKFETAAPLTNQTGFTPIISSVLDGDTPLNDGIAYLSIPGATIQSALVKSGGNFLIPISQIRKDDLSGTFSPKEDTIGKITIVSDKGTASLLFQLKANTMPLPPIKLGESIDLTSPEEVLQSYDSNNDGKINATDYAVVSSCFGKNPSANLPGGISCTKTDINGDKVVNQKDLDLMSQKLKNLGSQ